MQVTTCYILAGFQVLLSVTGMFVDLSVIIAVMRLRGFWLEVSVRGFCSTYPGDSFCSKYVGDNFNLIMLMGVSGTIMQVVFSAVHYAHDCVYCNYAGDFPLKLCR